MSNVTLRAVFELSNSSVQKDNFDTPQSSQVRLRHEAFGDVLSHTVTSYISFMCSNTGYVSLSKSELPEDKFFLPNSIHLKKKMNGPQCVAGNSRYFGLSVSRHNKKKKKRCIAFKCSL